MRQNKQSVSLLSPRRFALSFVVVAAAFLCLAVFNSERTRAQQPNTNSAAQKSRPKRLTPLRTSETPDGSRATITSDGELNDYSAYRSGDRFIVVVPQAEGTGGGGARGRGFEGAQVERRGKDVVYTFKLQPGATARVNQKFNRLDVQFSAPKGANANATAANARPTPTPTPKPTRGQSIEEAGITKPAANAANTQPTPGVRPTPDANANNSLAANTQPTPFTAASPATSPLSGVVPTPTPAPTGPEQIAQVQPTPAAPVSITTNAPANAPTSVGAVVMRNWPWLIAALLAVGIGLLFVSRFSGNRDQSKSLPPSTPSGTKPPTIKETKPAGLKPTSAASTLAATNATGATAATPVATSAPTPAATPAAATSAAATAATTAAGMATSGKQSKKKKKKEAEKAKRLTAANELKSGGADAGTGAANAGTIAASKEAGKETGKDAEKETSAGGALAAGALIAGAAAVASVGASEVEESRTESKAAGTKSIELLATGTKAVEPPVAFDPERIEVEIKKLLTGESYDESLINTSDAGTRQLVSAELMQAIAGRNVSRQAHARAAFLKHGYFEEATNALQSAEAPGERASAARTLGLYGDRSATAHLTAALEDPAADVRRTAVESLAELADPAAIGALEALRWRETSRQVPRTLIQRAIEACKAAEEEETAAATATTLAADDDTPTLVTTNQVEAVTVLDAAPAPELETSASEAQAGETKEIELSGAETPSATTVSVAGDSVTQTPSAPVLNASLTETPETSVADEDAPVAVEAAPIVEATGVLEEAKGLEAAKGLETETKALELAAPHVEDATAEDALAEDVRAEVETTDAPVEVDLAATLAAKEANLIKARAQQAETLPSESVKAIEAAPFSADTTDNASSADSSFTPPPATSFDLHAPANPEAASTETAIEAVTEVTTTDAATQVVYHSDFAVGSGAQTAAVEDDWIDLDADEQEVTIQSIEPVHASAQPTLEPPGPFYVEDADVRRPASNTTDAPAPQTNYSAPVSAYDSLEVGTFETNAAEPMPDAAKTVDFALLDDTTLPSARENYSPAKGDQSRETGLVKADKGLASVADEESYSIIPKGIQLRLASDEASERAASVLALSRLNTDEAFNEICLAFDDSSEEVRNAAARALYDLNEDRADSFTRALRESPLERRRQIGAALAGSGLADEAVGNLTGESRDKTYDAFSLLFLMAKAGEVAPLIRAIESHHDNEVRLAVVKLLALSGQHDILPAFRRLAVRGSLPTEVRSAVMEAIYQISSQPQNATPAT